MTLFFVDSDGVYLGGFDGTDPPDGAIEVPAPPSNALFETWDGSQWIEDPDKDDIVANTEIATSFEGDRVKRLLFEIEFDQDARLRVLEGKAPLDPILSVAKSKYRNALKAVLKTL